MHPLVRSTFRIFSAVFSQTGRLISLSVPPLDNYPDGNGGALIHRCAAVNQPSIDMLDALCRAGAGIALFSLQERPHSSTFLYDLRNRILKWRTKQHFL
ncbi:hypothetical protein CPC08DRAFT_460308 [Agrocybe pediades]|nr:hypothetical protein CPC08DRAFT_460308 [Agrocybe pediades]